MGRHARRRSPRRAVLGSLTLLGAASAAGGAVGLGLQLAHAGPFAADGAGLSDTARAAATAPDIQSAGTRPGDPGPNVAHPQGAVVAQPSIATPESGARPTTVSIPALQVRSSLETLGLASGGTLNSPTDPQQAGWFEGGALPGQPGPAVLVGHVDSLDGPAVFADLSLLRQGDTITVSLSDGSYVRFQVTSVRRYAKDAFPTEDVYGARPDPQLRLITCGGTFDGDRYPDNVVVFARLQPAGARAR
ncbi:class F sortase [Streptomyces sp. AcH 505]|uniref:class F sortase n=1 Tax=Streptomyces sp. AcH 505 TaxID=352211 RepID=UPI0006944DCE